MIQIHYQREDQSSQTQVMYLAAVAEIFLRMIVIIFN